MKVIKEILADTVLVGLWCLIVALLCIGLRAIVRLNFAYEVIAMVMILGVGLVLIGVIVDAVRGGRNEKDVENQL